MKRTLIAKQFDKEALYLWIQDNIADIKHFLALRDKVLFWYFGYDGYDPAVGIYFGNKQEIRERIQTLRDYSKKVKEFETLRRKIFQAFKELNVPKDFRVTYNSSTNQEDPTNRTDIRFDYEDITAKSIGQRLKNKLAYAKFAIKVLQGILKIKGSKQKLRYEDDIVYEYDIFGNLIYKGAYNYSNWSQLEREDAFAEASRNVQFKPHYNEKLGVYLIGVSSSYRFYRSSVRDERSLDHVYSKLDYLVGFAVVRNE